MEYELLNKHRVILSFLYDEETHTIMKITNIYQPAYAPLGITEYKTGISRKALHNWWKDRSIPASRSNIKEILADMKLTSSMTLLEHCFGLSLSDQYWIREKGSDIPWEKVNFFQNAFSDDMGKVLMGQMDASLSIDLCSPDNSSDGNLQKKWKIIDGKRYLLKGGNSYNNQEPFNEVIATKLYERILEPDDYTPYMLFEEDGRYVSACETMVSTDEELVPAYYIDATQKLHGHDSLYHPYVQACQSLRIPHIEESLAKMLVCDYILANFDRHYRNFGAIRNIETLQWVRPAPLYDNGSSLWANTATKLIGEPYKAKPFQADAKQQLQLVQTWSWLDETKLDGFANEVYDILMQNPLCEQVRCTAIAQQVQQRIDTLIAVHHA